MRRDLLRAAGTMAVALLLAVPFPAVSCASVFYGPEGAIRWFWGGGFAMTAFLLAVRVERLALWRFGRAFRQIRWPPLRARLGSDA